ncbi:calcium-binding protein E63-1 isoform X4 [Sitodiplosis mosellana]|nr:calcium-binding protein E63-1 isoform X4 [Sitodiplosis mosellana]XP_055325213.1 calcium-binding protein E63-1 isoform X4 [Sitodiplosis mosellana]
MLGSALIGRRHKDHVKKKGFTEEELHDLRIAFELLDRNQDGRVTAGELQFMLKNLGIIVRDELIDDLIKEASHGGNGRMDEKEFRQWIQRIQSLQEESTVSPSTSQSQSQSQSQSETDDDITQDLIAAFRVFDRDGNGYITRDELQIAMEMMQENVTETQVNEMLQLADLDKDGKINYEEFVRLLL